MILSGDYMKIKIKKYHNFSVFCFRGRFDVYLSAKIEKRIKNYISENDVDIIFNLQNIEFMSSSGLRMFISIQRELNARSLKLKFCNPNDTVKNFFDIIQLMDMFDFYRTEKNAIDSILSYPCRITSEDTNPELRT